MVAEYIFVVVADSNTAVIVTHDVSIKQTVGVAL